MIVLTTPTGNIGSKVLRAILKSKTELIRLIARDKSKLPADLPSNVEVVSGRTDDRETLLQALAGADVLFWCQPDTPTAEDYVKAYEDWSYIALDAINTAALPRVVAITAAGGQPSIPAGPVTALYRLEQILSQSSAACRFLQCGSFYSNVVWQWENITRDGVFAYSLPGHISSPQVATEDIAKVAAGLLVNRDWDGKKPISLPGPRDLSYDEMAEELTRHLGRPVRYECMPPDAYRELSIQLGLSSGAAQGLVDMFQYFAAAYKTELNADRALTPTTFAEWLENSKF